MVGFGDTGLAVYADAVLEYGETATVVARRTAGRNGAFMVKFDATTCELRAERLLEWPRVP